MRGVLLALVVGVVAGCAPSGTPEEVRCRREAERSPEVADLVAKGAGSPTFLAESQDTLKVARQQAFLGCLRGSGAIRPGGVERQRPL